MVTSMLCEECMHIFIVFSSYYYVECMSCYIFCLFVNSSIVCLQVIINGSIYSSLISHSILGCKHMSITATH
jgi:hypothetical protein